MCMYVFMQNFEVQNGNTWKKKQNIEDTRYSRNETQIFDSLITFIKI